MATERIQIAEETTCQQILQILQNGGGDTEKIVQIKALLENTTYGLSALKNILGNSTYGLNAIKSAASTAGTNAGKRLKYIGHNVIRNSGTFNISGAGMIILFFNGIGSCAIDGTTIYYHTNLKISGYSLHLPLFFSNSASVEVDDDANRDVITYYWLYE